MTDTTAKQQASTTPPTPSNENASKPGQGDREGAQAPTLTQDQVNALIAETKRKTAEKFADYDELKTKAAELDAQKDASRTDVERATAAAEKATAALEAAKAENHQLLVEAVAAAKGVPAAHITGATREELEASADQLVAWRGALAPAPAPRAPGAPPVPRAGTGSGYQTGHGSLEAGRERSRNRRGVGQS